MPDLEMNVSMLKCPICDTNHNYKVEVDYSDEVIPYDEESPPYYNTFKTTKKVGEKIEEVQVFEIDAFCHKNGIPFRIIVDPPLPPNTHPTKFLVTATA